MMEKNTLFLEFVRAEEERYKLELPARIDEVLQYEETVIRKDYDKVSKDKSKGKKRREFLTEQYTNAFSTLSRQEKVELYCSKIDTLKKLINGTLQPFDQTLNNNKETEVYIKGYRLGGWKKKTLRVNRKELCIQLERPNKVKKHDLYNYIYRKSKNNQYFSFVLESINGVPKDKYKTIHLGFTNINQFNQWFEDVKAAIDFAKAKTWAQQLGVSLPIANNQGQKKLEEAVSNGSKQPQEQSKQLVQAQVQKPAINPQPVPEQKNVQNKLQQPQKPSTAVSPIKKQVAGAAAGTQINIQNNDESQKAAAQQQNIDKPRQIVPIGEQPNVNIQLSPVVTKKQSKLVDRIMKENIQMRELQNLQTEYNEVPEKKPNLIDQILPDYNLKLLTSEQSFQTLEYQNKYRLLQSSTNPKNFKIFMNFSFSAETIFQYVVNLQTFRNWNTQVQEMIVKTLIASQNTAIMYMKIKAYSRIYRARDFLFLRHAFRKDNELYLVDNSIENVNYPPFYTIVRGKLQTVWGFLPNSNNSQSLLVIDMVLNNEGFLNDNQNTNLATQYLKKLHNLQSYIVQKSFRKQQASCRMFDVGPPPSESKRKIQSSSKISQLSSSPEKETEPFQATKPINRQSQESDIGKYKEFSPTSPIKVQEEVKEVKEIKVNEQKVIEEDKGEIPLQELEQELPKNTRVPELDQEGHSILSQTFVKTKYRMVPWERQLVYETNYLGPHHIWRDEWKVDDQSGGCWFIDEKKQQQQRKVFSYILSKMGKNLLSGKGILNVSLPVQVFSSESNLETLAKTFAYAPLLLEQAAAINQPLEQMKYVIAFGFTVSLLYAKMQKPFNPILGQTLQCSFKGCPVFVEQVCHHPPIAAFYMVGRGYRYYGSIESKMDLSLNSGTGYNAGDNVVKFDNGTQVRFRTPGGQISGLTFGQRKLALTNKSFYWEPNLGYMIDIAFNPGKKGWFSKQESPIDYFEGTMKKVKKEFILDFEEKKSVFKPSPSSKDVLQEYYKVHGRWTHNVIIEDKQIYNVDKDHFIKYDLEPNPLPSDCMYREDVVYKRLGNISRSQNEKERLEIIQRKDRKLRQKLGGGKH